LLFTVSLSCIRARR